MKAAQAPPNGSPADQLLAVELLFRREYDGMYRLAAVLLGSDSDADEIVQDAFLAVSVRLDDLDTPGAYLRVAVVNGARRRLRDRRNRQAVVDNVGALSSRSATGPVHYLSDVLEALPERERTAVVLRYYAGLNASEIGELFGCPSATVRSLLHRALKELRRVLEL